MIVPKMQCVLRPARPLLSSSPPPPRMEVAPDPRAQMQVARGSRRTGGPSLSTSRGPPIDALREPWEKGGCPHRKRTAWCIHVPLGVPVGDQEGSRGWAGFPSLTRSLSLDPPPPTLSLPLSLCCLFFSFFSLAEMTPISGARDDRGGPFPRITGTRLPGDFEAPGGCGGRGERARPSGGNERRGGGEVCQPTFCQGGYYPPWRLADTWDGVLRVSQFHTYN